MTHIFASFQVTFWSKPIYHSRPVLLSITEPQLVFLYCSASTSSLGCFEGEVDVIDGDDGIVMIDAEDGIGVIDGVSVTCEGDGIGMTEGVDVTCEGNRGNADDEADMVGTGT